eukprot:6861745-Pyramimonas_sp.AAC.1
MLRQWGILNTVLQATVEYYSHESCIRALFLQYHYYTSTPLSHNSTKQFLQRYYCQFDGRSEYDSSGLLRRQHYSAITKPSTR